MEKKLLSFNELENKVKDIKKRKKKIILVSGVFDLLHLGHIKYFSAAKKLGDILIVSLTTDEYVRKGFNRPVFNQYQRAEVLSSIKNIDFVVFSKNFNCLKIIKSVKPNIYFKGPDYKDTKNDLSKNILKEINLVKKFGGKTEFANEETFSSTNLISNFLSFFTKKQQLFINNIKKKYDFKKVVNYINSLEDLNVTCVGEIIIDKYMFTETIGKSGKEPYLVHRVKNEESYSGGSAAIANQISEFTKKVSLISMIGDRKDHLSFIKKKLNNKINFSFIKKKNSPTIVKERYLETISKSKVFGTYIINDEEISRFQENELINLIQKSKRKDSMIVISDYGHGLITKNIAKYFSKLGKKVYLNTQLNAGNWGRHSLLKYKNINTLLLNERELRYEMRDDNTNINLIAKKLMKYLKIENLIITKGSSGAILINLKYGKIINAPALTSNVIDKVGSGDAMLSIISLCLKNKIPYDLALFFGIIIGSLSVQIIGNKRQITKLEFLKTIEYLLK